MINNVYVITSWLTTITASGAGILTYLKNPKGEINKRWGLMSSSIAIWSLFLGFMFNSKNTQSGLVYSQILMIGASMIPVTFYHFVLALLEKQDDRKQKKILSICYLATVFLLLINPAPLFIKGISYKALVKCFYPDAGSLFIIYVLLYLGLSGYACFLMFKAFNASGGRKKNQIAYVMFASMIGFLGGATTFPLWYQIQIPPIGSHFVWLYTLTITFAIIKYHLLDIKIAVTRGGIFAVVYLLVLGIPFLLGYRAKSWLIPTIFMAIFATLGPYIYSCFRRQTEMRLRREEFAQHKTLRILSQNMLRFTKLDTLLKLIVHRLVKVLKLRYVCVYLKNPESADYELKSAWCLPDKPVFPQRFAKDVDFIRDVSLKKASISWHQQEGVFGSGLIIPVFLRGEILGFLILGEKRSNAIFTQDDINIFLFLANQASLAIENARFLQKQETKAMDISKEQLARDIAYGVSHQFNNRLYIMGLIAEPILLAYKDKNITSLTKEEQETFFSKSLKAFSSILQQVKEGGQIAQGIMGFATISKKGDFEKLNITPLIERALQATQLKHSKSAIEGLVNCPLISSSLPKEAPLILASPSQVQDVFFVLFDNALDALEDNSLSQSLQGNSFTGRITISLQNSDSHIRIFIEDNGTGIKPEHMKRVFLPYFTTKKATDIKGRGLGLSIIKQFVRVNKGRIYVESEYGSWARFVVEFPIAK